MPVHLKVIGIFFGVKIELVGPVPVADVLAAGRDLVRKGGVRGVTEFAYELTQPPHVSAVSFTAVYNQPVHGRAIHLTYPPGEYYLAENTNTAPSYTVWQYYVLNADKTPVERGVKFLDDPAAVVPDGGTLIWRLVSILKTANGRPPVAYSRQSIV